MPPLRRKPALTATSGVSKQIVPLPLGAPGGAPMYDSGSEHNSDDDEDIDSDDEDFEDIFQNLPPKTKPQAKKPIAVRKRKEEVLTPIDELVIGGKFVDANGQPGHTRLRVKFVQQTEKTYNSIVGQASFRIAINQTSEKKLKKQKGQLQINCCHDGQKARKDCACVFGLSAYVQHGYARITYINMDHSQNCKVHTEGGRQRGAKTAFLGLDGADSWASSLQVTGPSTLRSANGQVLQNGVAEKDGYLMSRQLADKIIRQRRGTTLPQFLWNLTKVAPFLLACQTVDPGGHYLLGTKKGTFELEGVDEETMREFEWIICIPSYATGAAASSSSSSSSSSTSSSSSSSSSSPSATMQPGGP